MRTLLLTLACLSLFCTNVIAERMPDHIRNAESVTDWDSKDDAFWKTVLSDKAVEVCREGGTERAYSSDLNDNKRSGVYVCSSCGQLLFSSDQKYDSKTGWPSFTAPASLGVVEYRDDSGFFTTKTEVVCSRCKAHLGHVFDDGPEPEGKRYCINGVCLFFVEAMESGDAGVE